MKSKLVMFFIAAILVLAVSLPYAPASLANSGTMEVVATGLDNPRGLAFGPDGNLYVVEAGKGGEGPCAPGPEGDEVCYGASGAITRVNLKKQTQMRVLSGLPSLAAEGGVGATGVHDIAFVGRNISYYTIGLGGNPLDREANFGDAGRRFDQLVNAITFTKILKSTDLGDYEAAANPDGGEIDSNPYSVLALPGRTLVVDAGANALLEIKKNGSVSTLAVFPDRMVDAPPFLGLPPGAQIPMQSVPTTVILGPDGNYYVGELTGFPFPIGAANIYRVPRNGGTPEVVYSGFTNIIDIAMGKDGSLYVLEITKNSLLSGDLTGALIHVDKHGNQHEILSEGLIAPGGLTIGRDGTLYVTINSIFPGAGQVVRIRP